MSTRDRAEQWAMRKEHAYKILTSRGWLAEIEPALASAIVAAGRLTQFRRTDTLYSPGDDPGGIYGVVWGGIVLCMPGRYALPVAGHIIRRCDWFGYGSFFDGRNRKFIPTANEPSSVLHVPLGELERLGAKFPSARRAFGQLSMRGEDGFLAIITDLLIANTDRRLAAVLLRVTGADSPDRNRDLSVDPLADPWAGPNGVPLTQALLAELANASPHTVARFVDRAVQAAWIDWKYGRVRILDFERLAAFAAGQ